jgi:cytochrome c peroxidase
MKKIFLIITIFTLSNCNLLKLNKEKSNGFNPLLLLLLGNPKKEFQWNLPPGFPIPRVPEDNPMTQEKVDLGRFLFFEKKLSGDNSMSCGGCHLQNLAFSDGRITPRGITNEKHPRNSQPLFNVAYNSRQTWNNILLVSLEQQMHIPLFGENPVELGLVLREEEIRQKLKSDSRYMPMFQNAFPNESEPITVSNIIKSIACFERIMISGNSPYDKATYQGNRNALSPSARRGLNFFSSEVAECFHCHDGVNFNDSTMHSNTSSSIEPLYHNNALYNISGSGNPTSNLGLIEVTGNSNHRGKFKAPSLRNIGLTFPYMHDGSISCDDSKNPHITPSVTMDGCAREALGRVIDQYSRGGNNSSCAAFLGDGSRNPAFPCISNTQQSTVDSTLIRQFPITAQEKEDLINFLLSLTDNEFLSDPRFSNPF